MFLKQTFEVSIKTFCRKWVGETLPKWFFILQSEYCPYNINLIGFCRSTLFSLGTLIFISNAFFSIQPQCWLTFSWIGLKCCSGVAWYIQEYLSSLTSLVDISIIIMRRFLYLLYLCQFLDRGLFILYICGLFFFFFLHFRYD